MNENKILQELKKFNNEKEDIFLIHEYCDYFFIVTRKFKISYNGKLVSVVLKGYEYFKGNIGYSSDKSFIQLCCNGIYHGNPEFLDCFFIEDFTCDELKQNRGFGSLLLDSFIKYAIEQKVKFIKGKLSPVDIGYDFERTQAQQVNYERLVHFYQKHGFSISEDKEILLRL